MISLVPYAALFTRLPGSVSIVLTAVLMSAGGALSIDLKNYAKPFSVFIGI